MNKKVINGIRQYYQLPREITNKQITKNLKGSFGEAIAGLGIVKENLVKAFRDTMPRIFRKCFKI